jgi:hypothetical protein
MTHLGERSSKDDDLVDFAHFSQEMIDARSLDNIHVMRLGFDFDGDNVICGR